MRSPRLRSNQIDAIRRSVAAITPLSKMLRAKIEPEIPSSADANGAAPSLSPTRAPITADRRRIIRAVHQLQDLVGKLADDQPPLIAGFDADVADDRGRGFLGPRGDHHGLAAYFPELLRPLEPNFTRRLAHVLSPELSGIVAIQRAQTFIGCLFDAAATAFPAERLPYSGGNLVVEAEARVPDDKRKRRIDLLINWTDRENNAHCLVVEAKFDAPVRPEAMRVYSTFARQIAGAPERTHLFLVLKQQRALALDDANWQQVTWLSVLRRWERHLAVMPADEDFAHFRSALWRRA